MTTTTEPTVTDSASDLAGADMTELRQRIDDIDAEIIRLWQERSRVSQQVGQLRMAAGGTRLVLGRERAILERFRSALGDDGTQVAMLLLRAGRGPL